MVVPFQAVIAIEDMTRIYVVGIGYRPLEQRTSELVRGSRTVLASGRLLEVFMRYEEYASVSERVRVINNIEETISYLKNSLLGDNALPVVLLASGDPMFFGIGRRVLEEIGADMVEIIPDLSSIQLAFARIKKPWDDAFLISLHGGPSPNRRRKLEYGLVDLPALLSLHPKIAILTDRVNNPSVIANTLLESEGYKRHSAKNIKIVVCEKLGYTEEHLTEGSAAEIASGSFSDPNVVIIMKDMEAENPDGPDSKRAEGGALSSAGDVLFGLNEDEISHSRGLITKDEVRAAALHKLRLPASGVLWDIGAGSGSVSIEAALLQPGLKVFAVEKDEEQITIIHENVNRFKVANVSVLRGIAPDVLKDLPEPSRVFIGGSSGKISEIIDFAGRAMKEGIIVINAATIETLSAAAGTLKKAGYKVSASQVSVSRMQELGEGHFFAARNPVFIINGQKQA